MITDKQMQRYEELAQDLESTVSPNYDVSAAARMAVPPLVAEIRYLRRQLQQAQDAAKRQAAYISACVDSDGCYRP